MEPVLLHMNGSQRQYARGKRKPLCRGKAHKVERAGVIGAVKSEEGNIQGGKGDDGLTWKQLGETHLE